MAKKEIKHDNIKVLDATGQSAGRLATQIAIILTGKNRVDYKPNVVTKVKVLVENVAKLKFTGKKLDQKEYISHSGHPGGWKSVKMGKVFKENPANMLERTVFNMLP
ncbi:MAG: uL13 family ribosomal protein, partial [bacterium]